MCKNIKCEICESLIKNIPRFCSNKCRGIDTAKWLWKKQHFIWDLATEEERENHIREYYMKNVIKSDECWDWKFENKRFTYPRMHFSKKIPRIPIHTFSWKMHNGPIPNGMFVLHKCDNRRCSRPDHLFLGTHQDNMNDMKLKKRQAQGERHGSAKLNELTVKIIREKLKNGISLNKLANEFKVSKHTILRIKQHKTWTHIT